MKKSLFFSAVLMLWACHDLAAQKKESWKVLAKAAEVLAVNKDYGAAADHYERAWRLKDKKTDFAFAAAENYYLAKNYRKAAELYEVLRDEADEYPLLGLKYARSLKQDGQYARAVDAFEGFLNTYNGEGKAMLRDIISNEVAGCELGTQLPAQMDRTIEVVLPEGAVNTDRMEFGPISTPDGGFWFSSDRGGIARIYSVEQENGTPGAAKTPENFPVIQNGQYCNGSFTPDGERFYFTICNANERWDDINTRCEIYFLNRTANGWSAPQRLPDFVNAPGVNATHPLALFVGGEEVLFFSANLEGGRGGMDLWYVKRNRSTPDAPFSRPVNLGPVVNTAGHEITPFFDTADDMLYFSSTGQVSIGGFDVFRTKGSGTNWSAVENAGMPYNSSADDFGFVMDVNQTGGYLVSNRPFGGQKPNTTNTDVFRFNNLNRRLALRGAVYDKALGEIISDVQVDLYQILDGIERPVGSDVFGDGRYEFIIEPNQKYKVECYKMGYLTSSFAFETNDPTRVVYGEAVFMDEEPTAVIPSTTPTAVQPTVPNNAPKVDPAEAAFLNVAGKEYSASGNGPDDQLTYRSKARRYRGDYFKIQVSATARYNLSQPKFKALEAHGTLETEYLTTAKITRIMIGVFFDAGEAFAALNKVKAMGFPQAFVVKYTDGLRYGKINP